VIFNSYSFVLVFLPTVLLGYQVLGKLGRSTRLSAGWLAACSLLFYSWFDLERLAVLAGSLMFNYACGALLASPARAGRTFILIAGIAANLGLLGYYKYLGFLVDTLNSLGATEWSFAAIILLPGISFFTFQQIAYLVDAYAGKAREYDFVDYALFVSFFPQLIAGPIVHHSEMMPQFRRPEIVGLSARNFSIGMTMFTVGLFEKVIVADGLMLFVGPVFSKAAGAQPAHFTEAWIAALAYTLQLYFDFAGYSDMALGLGRLFGIRIPLNFNSPYRAASIIDFWQRWHMTLSRFLRDYLYIPLGGNRRGPVRRYANLLITMLLGGLWHGAGWTFVAWGGLHGVLLMINHGWRALRGAAPARSDDKPGADGVADPPAGPNPLARFLGRAATLLAVVCGWVLFRADTFAAAGEILTAMFGGRGFTLSLDADTRWAPLYIALAGFAAIALPNLQELMGRYSPTVGYSLRPARGTLLSRLQWRPTACRALLTAALFLWTVSRLSKATEFIYYRF
jgi:D-alanyl-lipoteichoic acid acyltransferase DltB (MBOAT superfamily)